MNVLAVNYDEVFLKLSWKWLNDPEIKRLTNTPNFSFEDQKKWYEELQLKKDYKIWGININDTPVGVFGIKNIKNDEGEYWGFIGEKQFWGNGIGDWMLIASTEKAKLLGLQNLFLCSGTRRSAMRRVSAPTIWGRSLARATGRARRPLYRTRTPPAT